MNKQVSSEDRPDGAADPFKRLNRCDYRALCTLDNYHVRLPSSLLCGELPAIYAGNICGGDLLPKLCGR